GKRLRAARRRQGHTYRRRRFSAAARSALRFLPDAALLDVGQATAHVHEAAALGVLGLAAPRGVSREAGTGRNEPSDDHVLLQAAQIVLQTTNRRFGQHAGGLLERSRG